MTFEHTDEQLDTLGVLDTATFEDPTGSAVKLALGPRRAEEPVIARLEAVDADTTIEVLVRL